jgi:hypothetical protein
LSFGGGDVCRQLKEAGDEIFEALISDADSLEVENYENGVQSYTASFKISDSEDTVAESNDTSAINDSTNARPWWQRIIRRG